MWFKGKRLVLIAIYTFLMNHYAKVIERILHSIKQFKNFINI